MSVAPITHYSSVNAHVLSGGHWLPKAMLRVGEHAAETTDFRFYLNIPQFQFQVASELSDIPSAENHSIVTLMIEIDPGLMMLFVLKTEIAGTAGNFGHQKRS